MLSTKVQKESFSKKTPFTNYFNPYEQYKMKIQHNAHLLKNHFPSKNIQNIKELLQQLDNNIEMAKQILEEECGKSSPIRAEKSKMKMPEHEQSRILKKAVACLYSKLMKVEKRLEQTKNENQYLKKENEAVKMQNVLLLNKQYYDNNCEFNKDVF